MEQLAPVTLIVKAPNQKVEDRRIACDKSWTVRQLKEHLSTVYPEKPKEDQQKLVYYGKLLKDESHLHEVLTHDSYEDAHTVHLVCPQHASARSATSFKQSSLPRYFAADAVREPQPPESNTDFVRNRFAPAPPPQLNPLPYPFMAGTESELTPQQRLWMQTYQQQYWLYYNQLQQMAMYNHTQASPPSTPPVTAEPDNVPGAAEGARQQQPAQNAGNAVDDGMVQMNAQGGVDAPVQRDWLDHVYSLFRLFMILTLFYFYTTLSRFIAVCAIACFFYVAGGAFRIQRRQVNREPQPQPAPAEQNQAENQNNENEERSNPPADNLEPENTAEVPDSQQQQYRVTNFFRLSFSLVVGFFTSLIPQQPDLHAN